MGATAFSQDFEREADYVGMNIYAAAGHSTSAAPAVWRRIAQLDPTAIRFGTTHPTTAERYVRLGQWGQEIDKQIAAGKPLRLAMKNGSQSAPLPVIKAEPTDATAVAPRVVAQAPSTPSRVSQSGAPAASVADRTAASGKAATDGFRDQPKTAASTRSAATASPLRPLSSPSRILRSDSTVAVAVIGPPSSDSARVAAVGAFSIARTYLDRHEWGKAEDWFKHTLELDGSLATYHAALGSVEMFLEKWEEAEAEYTAALMIDLGNQEYRAQIMEARRRKGR